MNLVSPTPARIDRDLYDALTVPARQSDYPSDSRAFVRIDTSLRIYWHTLFDICPQLLELAPPDGRPIFLPFMAWAAEQNLSFDWTYYLFVYHWLQQSEFRDRLSEELMLPLVGASAARWAVLDRGADSGIVVGSAGCPKLVVAWKCHKVDGGREVELLELEEPLPDPDEQFGFFTLRGFEIDAFPGWRSIPR
jgi:uncharacterized repeat protein (TIGR04061 family)